MTDVAALVEQLAGSVGGVDGDLVAAAIDQELDRMFASGALALPAEGPIVIDRLRVDASGIPADRLADPSMVGTLLARAIADVLRDSAGARDA
jgi:hypothetical protein